MRCANCKTDLTYAREIGASGLYSPDRHFDLCISCFEEEDAWINENGNVNPERIARYKANVSGVRK